MSVTMGNVIASPQHADARAAIMQMQSQSRMQEEEVEGDCRADGLLAAGSERLRDVLMQTDKSPKATVS